MQAQKGSETLSGPLFWLGGFPYENRLQKKGYPCSNLSEGLLGPCREGCTGAAASQRGAAEKRVQRSWSRLRHGPSALPPFFFVFFSFPVDTLGFGVSRPALSFGQVGLLPMERRTDVGFRTFFPGGARQLVCCHHQGSAGGYPAAAGGGVATQSLPVFSPRSFRYGLL